MKNLSLIILLALSCGLAAQPYQINHWYTLTAGAATTGEPGGHVGAEAHLALDNKVFTVGYRYNRFGNSSRNWTAGHDFYLATGFHFPLGERFNMDFRLGPMLTLVEGYNLTDGNSDNEDPLNLIPAIYPQLQGSFKFNKDWAISTGLALSIPAGVYAENWLQFNLGLRFGDWPGRSVLPQDKRKVSAKRTAIKQDFYINTLAGSNSYGFTPGFEFGIVTGKWLLKLGYFNQAGATESFTLDGYYVGTGIEFQPLKYSKLLAHFLVGVGNVQIEEELIRAYPGQVVEIRRDRQEFLTVVQPALSYKILSWLNLTAQYSLLLQDFDETNNLWQAGLQLRF